MKIEFYDTTLRDGAQSEDVSFSLTDKLLITERLDDFGIHYIEGGWPGSNPKDAEYFRRVKEISLKRAKIVAFSSTFKKKGDLERDENVRALLQAETEYVSIVGKSWDLHVRDDLKVSLDENLRMIERTIAFLKARGRRVFFDAEHFFDGYKRNIAYAKKVLKTAEQAGADLVVLCDTNGGAMPYEVYEIVKAVKGLVGIPLGIHTHNDTDMAVANSIMAIQAGCTHVQGTINGYGERCGNANLCSIIPIAVLKMGHEGIEAERLRKLRELSLFVDEMANFIPDKHRPFVGESAFAHKGGIHVSAVKKNPETYEHIRPELVGNRRRMLVSELSGTATILAKAKEYGIQMESKKGLARDVLKKIKELEMAGYEFQGAEASLELLLRKMLGLKRAYFELLGFKVIVEK
jgi:2-isopropylmalate synthase